MKPLRQHNIPWLGALVDSLYTSLPILSIINFISITTILYASVREYLFEWVPWLTIWIFMGVLAALTMVLMVMIYLFVLPSLWTFRNKQMNKFESDVLKEVRELRQDFKEADTTATILSAGKLKFEGGIYRREELERVIFILREMEALREGSKNTDPTTKSETAKLGSGSGPNRKRVRGRCKTRTPSPWRRRTRSTR